MNEKLLQEFNVQIKEEFYSAYLYLAMSAKAREMGFEGIANWFFVQFEEEMDHGKGIFNFLQNRKVVIDLQPIPEPEKNLGDSIATLFEMTLAHEKHITGLIQELYKMAIEQNDISAVELLRWYISEQVEEESNATKYLDKSTKAVNDSGAMSLLNEEQSTRVYAPMDPVKLSKAT